MLELCDFQKFFGHIYFVAIFFGGGGIKPTQNTASAASSVLPDSCVESAKHRLNTLLILDADMQYIFCTGYDFNQIPK